MKVTMVKSSQLVTKIHSNNYGEKKEIYIIYNCLNTGIHIHAYHTAGYLTGFYFLS